MDRQPANKRKRSSLLRWLHCELLEKRELLAGDVCQPLPHEQAIDSSLAEPSVRTLESTVDEFGHASKFVSSLGRPSHQYTADGQLIGLSEHPTRIAVRVTEEVADPTGWLPSDVTKVLSLGTNLAIYESPYLTAEELATLAASGSQVSAVVPVFFNHDSNSEAVVVDELIVAIEEGVDVNLFFDDARFDHYRPLRGTTNQFVVTLRDAVGEDALDVAGNLGDEAGVVWATPNFISNWQRYYTPDDPRFGNQWHLNNTGQGGGLVDADQDLPEAWDIIQGGSSTLTIGIYDDGVAIDHPDLNNWENTGEAGGSAGVDDDGNGWIDDFNGWNFVNDNNESFPTTSSDNHGTAVAGVSAAIGDNSLGVAGASYGTPVIAGRLFDGSGVADDAGISEGIYYLAGRTADGNGQWDAADLVNNSWGGGGASSAIASALTWATSDARDGAGVPFLFASGNGFAPLVSYPARYAATIPGVIAVGAHTNSGVRSSYSNYGTSLDVVAGSNGGSLAIDTTDRVGSAGYASGDYTGTGSTGFGGTSSATPLATGVAALLMARAEDQSVPLTAPQVRDLMRANTDLIGGASHDTTSGKNFEYGFGAINAASLVHGVGIPEISVTSATEDLVDAVSIVSFPDTPTGEFQDTTLRIRNQGTETLDISDVSVPSGPFEIIAGPADASLALGEWTTFTVRFMPTSAGTHSETLTITSNDADEGLFEIELEGAGLVTSIGGLVFEDGNVNGLADPNESVLPDVLVYLDENGNDIMDVDVFSFTQSTDVPILDFQTAVSTVEVSGLTNPIFDVNIELDITHTYDSDLTAELIAPDLTRIQLFANVGGDGNNFTDTILDDQAITPISLGSAPFTGSFRPQEPLTTFQNLDGNGTWTLEITDSFAADEGSLNEWTLEISTTEPFSETDAGGQFRFTTLDPGDYSVRSHGRDGYTQLTPASNEYNVTITDPNDSFTDLDFGFGQDDRFYAHVFEDTNGDGVIDAGEEPLEGRAVFIDANDDGVFQPIEDFSDTALGPLSIPDPANINDPVLSTLEVTGFTQLIMDVNVRVNIDHEWNEDLDVTLIAPDGTRVELFTDVGGSSDNFTDTWLDDEASIPITSGSAPFTGTYQPEGNLADLDGLDPNGIWTLEIVDDFPTIDDGVFNEWELVIIGGGETGGFTDTDGDVSFDLPPGPSDILLEAVDNWSYTVPADGILTETPSGVPLPGRLYGSRPEDLPAQVADVVVNGGDSQRSMTTEVQVIFNSEVNVDAAGFILENTTTGATADLSVDVTLVEGVTVATVTFIGGDALQTGTSSLINGNYLLTIDSSFVTDLSGNELDGDGDGLAGGNFLFGNEEVDHFYRLFGDGVGAGGSSETDRVVNFDDFFALRDAFGSASGDAEFRTAFDGNEDGVINFDDFFAFRDAFGNSLPFGD